METYYVLDEIQVYQFYSFCRHVRPPPYRDFPRYIVSTEKKAPKAVLWGLFTKMEDMGYGLCLKKLLPMEQSTLTRKKEAPNIYEK